MKVGALALLRGGRNVCVKTSCDSWSFGLKKHSILQEEVLTVFVSSKIPSYLNVSEVVTSYVFFVLQTVLMTVLILIRMSG